MAHFLYSNTDASFFLPRIFKATTRWNSHFQTRRLLLNIGSARCIADQVVLGNQTGSVGGTSDTSRNVMQKMWEK